jgi:hypothetical protein
VLIVGLCNGTKKAELGAVRSHGGCFVSRMRNSTTKKLPIGQHILTVRNSTHYAAVMLAAVAVVALNYPGTG